MEEEQIAPTDVERSSDLIRKAKFEVGKTDVLVCGKCHMVFYHIEEFQEHRLENICSQDSLLRENEKVEPKEQVWAFTLWKNSILHSGKRTEPLTTWTLYQRWSDLSESEKEAWIIAGQNLQTFTRLSLSRLHEIKGRTSNLGIKKKTNSLFNNDKLNSSLQNNETLEEGEVRLSQLSDTQRAAVKAQIAANKNKKETTEIRKVPAKLAQLYADLIKKPSECRKALRSAKNNSINEAVFEKVLSRRFNHTTKCLEYFVKWENMKESENTWEPKIHFNQCKEIIEEFDKVFNATKMINKTSDLHVESEKEQISTRPPRTSKQRARDQVKSWCDSMSDDDDLGTKRKGYGHDSDSEDSFEKKMKMEEETDTSDEERRNKKGKSAASSINGMAKKLFDKLTLQRVGKGNQKHLSTGVYIMSKTEGIIKINSDTSHPNSSPSLKVGQKIGQSHVKVVRKDMSKSPVKGLPKYFKSDGSFISDKDKSNLDDDSDGLSELEFPTDLPLPQPESPPGDFILDPLTGKIAGQEYTEEPPSVDYPVKSENIQGIEHEPTSLDSLVKMAVSDLPDIDEVNSNEKMPITSRVENISIEALTGETNTATLILDPTAVTIKAEMPKLIKTEIQSIPTTSKNNSAIDLESEITLTAIEKASPSIIKPKIKSESATSLLNAALTNSRQPQKKLLSTTPHSIRQKVVPRSHQMHYPGPSPTVIHKVPNRPKPFAQRTPLDEPIMRQNQNINTYKPASSVARRIGSTTIYKTGSGPKAQTPKSVVRTQQAYKPQSFVARISSMSSAPPINMPLIGIDDDPEAIASTSAVAIADPNETDLLPALPSDLPTINLADTETPLFITGEDGTIYQVAGQNEEGQTILISEGPDGQQQCVIVSTEVADEEPSEPLLLTNASEPLEHPQQTQNIAETSKMDLDEADGEQEGTDDSQVVAQIVKADPPSPGGTRKVVLMLPDGNLMMTDVTAEQYAALELDK